MSVKNRVSKEVYLVMVGNDVKKLQRKNDITYLNPVAADRAKIMRNKFNYNPIVKDAYTLKPDPNK